MPQDQRAPRPTIVEELQNARHGRAQSPGKAGGGENRHPGHRHQRAGEPVPAGAGDEGRRAPGAGKPLLDKSLIEKIHEVTN